MSASQPGSTRAHYHRGSKRILVVEDEALISMYVEHVLEEYGYTVVGPAGNVATALRIVAEETFDAALLDINIGGELVFPVADVLAERGIPFMFVTGYGSGIPSARYQSRPCLQKPFQPAQLHKMVKTCLASAG